VVIGAAVVISVFNSSNPGTAITQTAGAGFNPVLAPATLFFLLKR
jgi:hypothetical protein